MSGIKYMNYPLVELFKSKGGDSKYTKKYCNQHVGDYIVYTGTVYGDFAKVSTYDYETDNLTYTKDGVNAGTCQILTGKYNVGGHRALLFPIKENLDLEYFRFILEPIFKNKLKEGNVPSITWNRVKELEIPVPINDNGDIDKSLQQEIVVTYKMLENHKDKLKAKAEYLANMYIELPIHLGKFKNVKLSKVFKYERGSGCTKEYINKNKGSYPVYSANNDEPLGYMDKYQFDGKYITLSRNGIAGKVKILNEKFTINEDRFILHPLTEKIDLDYIGYILEPILRGKRRGREGHDGQNEFTKLSFSILDKVYFDIPVGENEEYDIIAQKKLANEYMKLTNLKNNLKEKIDVMINTDIHLGDK